MQFVRVIRGAAAVVMVSAIGSAASAGTLTASASGGGRSAQAVFAASGSNLVVTLTNTATDDIDQPIFVLTGVFFSITGPTVNLTRTSAIINAGSAAINFSPQPAGGDVGGEWAYKAGLVGAPFGATRGISSSGLGLFGVADLFPGTDLTPPSAPDGLQWGITTAGDNPATSNGGTNTPLIKNSVVFILAGLPAGFDPEARITEIGFQYGTALDEPQLQVPTPAAGLVLVAAFGLRRRRA
jgi:MYXO-CTERM domain-containing protein